MNVSNLIIIAAVVLATGQTATPPRAVRADVDRLVARAKVGRLWPWGTTGVEEIDRVVRHGKVAVPLLLALLPDNPDSVEPSIPDWRVQQHAALALCRIYNVSEECGHVYCNRALPEVNRGIKPFWLAKIAEAGR